MSAIARAIDVGYGHVKFSEGRSPEDQSIITDSFPSQTRIARPQVINGPFLQKRDTHIVQAGGKRYEVGKDILHATGSNAESEVLDHDFALSDEYAARLYAALNYMLPGLPERRIDYLVLGLPLNTFFKFSIKVSERFRGAHVINTRGDSVTVGNCHVYPQPLGSYTDFIAGNRTYGTSPNALVIDPGYNTIDWFVCKGLTVNEDRTGAAMRGMSAVLRAVANSYLNADMSCDASASAIVRNLDNVLSTGETFRMYGKPVDLAPHFKAGEAVVQEAIQTVKNHVGAVEDIEVIVLTGGGAEFYAPVVRARFPKHEVHILQHPSHANVRGFQIIAELLVRSASRAAGAQEAASV